jgi:hypothetical protein
MIGGLTRMKMLQIASSRTADANRVTARRRRVYRRRRQPQGLSLEDSREVRDDRQ